MTNQIRPYEPLTSENAALVLVDHQVGLMTGVRDYSTGELKHNVVALARAKVLKLPIVVTTTARDSMWGPTFPELVEALPGVEIIDRSSVNAFDDARVARAIEATGRKKLIFAGISLEVCAAFPAITALAKGLDAYVAVDASGTFSETTRL
jgi:nicotinamidase-related amidase